VRTAGANSDKPLDFFAAQPVEWSGGVSAVRVALRAKPAGCLPCGRRNFSRLRCNQRRSLPVEKPQLDSPKETAMLKGAVALVAVIVVAGAAHAQEATHQMSRQDASHRRLSQADLNALTDARIGMAKVMLQMTPEQARFWPPIEEAIRNGAEARYRRIAQLRAMMDRSGEREPDPIAIMRIRAEALSARGAQLKKLADAWQPLYQTLNPEQKDRMRLVASHVLHEARGAIERRMGAEADEGEEE
jgi:hypothetical protein